MKEGIRNKTKQKKKKRTDMETLLSLLRPSRQGPRQVSGETRKPRGHGDPEDVDEQGGSGKVRLCNNGGVLVGRRGETWRPVELQGLAAL